MTVYNVLLSLGWKNVGPHQRFSGLGRRVCCLSGSPWNYSIAATALFLAFSFLLVYVEG